jgi:hypothetical protein
LKRGGQLVVWSSFALLLLLMVVAAACAVAVLLLLPVGAVVLLLTGAHQRDTALPRLETVAPSSDAALKAAWVRAWGRPAGAAAVTVRMLMLLPLLVPLSPLPPLLRFPPKISAVGTPSAHECDPEDLGVLLRLLPRLLLLLPLLLMLLTRSNMLLAGLVTAAAAGGALKAARGLPQAALMVQVPS